MEDSVLRLDFQHWAHASAPQWHLNASVLGCKLKSGLINLNQLRLKLHHELEGLASHRSCCIQHREALVLRQRLHLQILSSIHLRHVRDGQRKYHPLTSRHLAKVKLLRVQLQGSGQHARVDAEIASQRRLPVGFRLVNACGSHANRKPPGCMNGAVFRLLPASATVLSDLSQLLPRKLFLCHLRLLFHRLLLSISCWHWWRSLLLCGLRLLLLRHLQEVTIFLPRTEDYLQALSLTRLQRAADWTYSETSNVERRHQDIDGLGHLRVVSHDH
mmetsp:Transcript_22689/g.41079  ORF Transcript_22689/g.41079 Transcript_22689/m.41079 type:complete len:273 (-) Transcript_22689:3300-4118(-)